MATPISALQRNAAAVIRRVVASGVSEEITDHGRVVAVLAPPPALQGLEKLRAEGHVTPATGGFTERLRLLEDLPGVEGLRAALDEQRDEREL